MIFCFGLGLFLFARLSTYVEGLVLFLCFEEGVFG